MAKYKSAAPQYGNWLDSNQMVEQGFYYAGVGESYQDPNEQADIAKYQFWEKLAKDPQSDFVGSTRTNNGNFSTELKNYVAEKEAQGFSFVNKFIDPNTSQFGFRGPDGSLIYESPIQRGGIGNALKTFAQEVAPIATAALTAGFGGQLASTLGVSQPVAAGLIGGGVSALGGGSLSDIAKSGLTAAAGSYAANSLAGNNALLTPEMQATISSNPQGAFLGESAIPYPVTSPTVTSGVLPAVDPFADAVVDQIGNVISGSTGEVLAPAAAAGGIDLSSIPQGIQEGMAPGVTAAVTPEELAAVGAVTGAGAAGAGALGGTDAAMADLAGSTQITPDAMAAATAAGTTLGVPNSLWGPIISSIASLYGGSQMANAASEAAQTQAAAYNRALDLQEQMYKEGVARQAPFLQGGTEAFNRLTALSTGGPQAAQNFLTMDPGYGFRLGEGMKALERLQASRGSLLSGGAIKAGQRYAQDVASQEYGNAYNRLAQLADVGPRAAGVTTQLGQNYATSAGNLLGQSGTNSANALLTGAAARQSAYGDIGNIWGKYLGGGQ